MNEEEIKRSIRFYEWLRQNFLIALNREMCEVIAKKAAEIFSETE